ncbi:MAG: adenylate/guanylate cyclase domain-containing protein [Paracoccaceae bacterium]
MTGKHQSAETRLRISLRVSVIAVLLGTVVLTTAAVHVPWMLISRENVAEMSRQLNGEIISGVNREVGAIFDSAVSAQTAIHDMLEDGVIDMEDETARERLFFAMLNANPHFSWVSFGKPNGDFFGAQRRDAVNLRLAESRWNPIQKHANRVETYFVNDGIRISQTVTKREENDYYAPGRSWYKAAVAAPGEHIWTDIYLFDTSRRPGLNTATTLKRPLTGALLGVLSVAIELERISLYLAELRSVRSGAAFIIDREGHLIAFPDPDEVTKQSLITNAPELKQLSESNHPMLRLANKGLAATGMALSEIAAPMQVITKTETGERYFLTVAPAARADWLVGTLIPEADFMGVIRANYLRLALAVCAALVLVGVLALLIPRYVLVRPLQKLMIETDKIARFDLDDVRKVESPLIEIAALSGSIEQMSRGLGSFRRYIPTDLVRTLLQQGVIAELGGERRIMSVMFMDLEGFTNISERLGHRVVPLLGDYFTAMTSTLQRHGGTIDKFIGDGVMAFWGAPNYDEEHPLHACRAALDCQVAMDGLRTDWSGRGLPEPRLRIGVTTGRVVVGNIGSVDRLNYTVIGDPVNLSARLEGMNKEFGTGILISQQTYELVKYDMLARRIDTVRVKGKDQPVAIYELLAPRDESGRAPGFEWVDRFETGFTHFSERRWTEAAQQFRKVIEMKGDDRVSRIFLSRIDGYLAAEPTQGRIRAVSDDKRGADDTV